MSEQKPPDPPSTFRHAVLDALAGRAHPASGEDLRIQTICLLVLTALGCGAAAWWLRDVLVPFVFAAFLTFVLQPLIDLLTRRLRLPHGLAIAITLLVGVVILLALATLISASVFQLTQSEGDYEQRVRLFLSRMLDYLPLERFGLEPQEVIASLTSASATSVADTLRALFNSLVNLVSHGAVVLIYLIFLLFGSPTRAERTGLWGEIRASIEHYMVAKTAISLVMGAVTWLVLNILGVPLPLVFGLLAFALNFIPNVGPIVATLLPLPMVVLSADLGVGTAVLAIVLPGTVHFILGYLVEPRVMGRSLDLDPVVVLLTLMLASVVWGPLGMLLATPMTAVARILLERLELTRPVAAVLAGRTD